MADKIESTHIFIQSGAELNFPGKRLTINDSALYSVELSKGALILRSGTMTIGTSNEPFTLHYTDRRKRFGFEGGVYSDTIEFATDGKSIYVINTLPVERYLEGVLPNEIGRGRKQSELEAAKAQAVIARTYAMTKIDLPITKLFDVYDDTRDQVFSGMGGRSRLTSNAVRSTKGTVLLDGQKYAECYYHSTCGGKTAALRNTWSQKSDKGYLQSIEDKAHNGDYCSVSPMYRWTEDYTRQELETTLKTYIPSANPEYASSKINTQGHQLLDMKISKRSESGRVLELRVFLGKGAKYETYVLKGDKIRWALRRSGSTNILPSTLFDLDITRDKNNWITSVKIHGGGNGHGVGLCQWGTIARAGAGFSMEEILEAYFPGTTVFSVY